MKKYLLILPLIILASCFGSNEVQPTTNACGLDTWSGNVTLIFQGQTYTISPSESGAENENVGANGNGFAIVKCNGDQLDFTKSISILGTSNEGYAVGFMHPDGIIINTIAESSDVTINGDRVSGRITMASAVAIPNETLYDVPIDLQFDVRVNR
jgi:uncharacterized protein (UPF0333 family)